MDKYKIDYSLCISIPNDERRIFAEQEFAKLGLSFEWSNGVTSSRNRKSNFNSAQWKALTKAANKGNVLICEDDVQFLTNDLSVIQQLPEGWDLFYFGGTLLNYLKVKVAKNLWKATGVLTSHAILYSAPAIHWILKTWKTDVIYDKWLATVAQNKLKCYLCKPFVAIQRPGKSRLWGSNKNYINSFRSAEQRMLNPTSRQWHRFL